MSKNFPGVTYCFTDTDQGVSTEIFESCSEHDIITRDQDLNGTDFNRDLNGFLRDISEPHTSRTSSSKNQGINFQSLMKNIAKALVMFILSELAPPYLDQIQRTDNENFEIVSFLDYIKTQREYVNHLKCFKSLFFSSNGENESEVIYKRVCRKMAIIFLKYFSVNWIFQSKLSNKQAYLRVRFKLLRQIRMVQ